MTPERQQPAVLFRKRLRSCKRTEPPCSLDKWPASSIKLPSSKGDSATSMVTLSLWSRFLLGLVQVAGFNSERELCNMVEKHRRCFSGIRTLSKSLDKDVLMSLLWWTVFSLWSVWTGCVCEWAKVTLGKPNVLCCSPLTTGYCMLCVGEITAQQVKESVEVFH